MALLVPTAAGVWFVEDGDIYHQGGCWWQYFQAADVCIPVFDRAYIDQHMISFDKLIWAEGEKT